ncbi:hypothetical protein [Streptosporangium sp. 'caverna']|uniref:hypothetical protein n=1 Tax=Streptosporangium sp. 'caverna' TaxID=2202249 RepID=UPI00195517F5|nr:hypothetical protein [Streptosporangium sp. 'caverna']
MNSVDQIGRLGLDRAIEVLDGKEVEKDTVVESPQITTENAHVPTVVPDRGGSHRAGSGTAERALIKAGI